jgi:DNA-binding PadR family transcriptional regulator
MGRDIPSVGEFEQIVLLAVLRLEGNAYGVSIRQEVIRQTGRTASRGSIYMTLERLEKKGLLRSSMTEPTPERGGRSKRVYAATKHALAALRHSRANLLKLWSGLEERLDTV